MVEKRLYRSESDRWIAGVCGGIAEYLDIDPVVIRLLWVVFTVLVGAGILIYILACLIIPSEKSRVKTKVDITDESDNVVNHNTDIVKVENNVIDVNKK